MREIIFRGKRIENNEWVYGYYHILTDTLANTVEHCILQEYRHTSDVVDPETVGQYTGLKDKNGTTIFEGDIVKDIAGGVYKVVYDTEYMRFAFEQDSIKWGLEGFDSIMDFEVIGNVFDNSELLKE